MMNQEEGNLRWYLVALHHWRWVIVGCTLMALGLAYLVSLRMPPLYSATTTLLVQPHEHGTSTQVNTLAAGERLAQTYSEMIPRPGIFQAVIEQLGLGETVAELADRVTVEAVDGTQLIRITVTHPNAQQAAIEANAIADEFQSAILQLSAVQSDMDRQGHLQEEIGSLAGQIETSQLALAQLRSKRLKNDNERTRLTSLLAEYRTNWRALQDEQLELDAAIAATDSTIVVVEPAYAFPSPSAESPITATTTLMLTDARMNPTYGQLIVGWPVLQEAISRLELGDTPSELAERIRVLDTPDSQLLRFEVEGQNRADAALLANTIAGVFIERVRELQNTAYLERAQNLDEEIESLNESIQQTEANIETLGDEQVQNEFQQANLQELLASDREQYDLLQGELADRQLNSTGMADTLFLAEDAKVPQEPLRRAPLVITLAGILGLLIGVGLALMLASLNTKIQTPEDVQVNLHGSTLGVIRSLSGNEDPWPVDDPRALGRATAESFHILATNLSLKNANGWSTILITSPGVGDGKSFVAGNLAVALAQRGQQVIFVEADLRRPRQSMFANLATDGGLTLSLQEEKAAFNLQPTAVSGLRVLASGLLPAHPSRLLASPFLPRLLDTLSREADFVIIDSPPILSAADATILAAHVDGVVVVLRADQTDTRAARDAVEMLQQVGANLIGYALNGVEYRQMSYYSDRGYVAGGDSLLRRIQGQLGGRNGAGDASLEGSSIGSGRRARSRKSSEQDQMGDDVKPAGHLT